MKETCTYLSVLNPEQLEAVCHTGSPLLILAGAGSGKTRVITTKIAWLIAEQGVQPESILAVTFTNKAAREMAERARLLDERTGRSVIRTFHSFGAWMLRRYAEWAGLSPRFTIYDDDDAVMLLMNLPQSIAPTNSVCRKREMPTSATLSCCPLSSCKSILQLRGSCITALK